MEDPELPIASCYYGWTQKGHINGTTCLEKWYIFSVPVHLYISTVLLELMLF